MIVEVSRSPPNRASLTAEYMALFRALESSRRSPSRLFFDPDAALFLTGARKWLARVAGFPAARQLAEWLLDRASPGARAAGVARTKWIDDEATAALKDATQLVLLGAGFDMRALRLPEATQVLTFELDHPQTSSAKQRVLKSEQRKLPSTSVTLVWTSGVSRRRRFSLMPDSTLHDGLVGFGKESRTT